MLVARSIWRRAQGPAWHRAAFRQSLLESARVDTQHWTRLMETDVGVHEQHRPQSAHRRCTWRRVPRVHACWGGP